ncbi:Hypothetical predicted protein [Mytilus galloprovincialis]|uniref:Uncharacterized protein n=1 Tax=Mytilus galloprovincialis TaxID=29158 RepID=A0A8B6GCH7_MYTGA|nr:Hypothetical predicted protein [Mytilus galloprovincialis]
MYLPDTEGSTPSVKNKEKGDIIISITIQELILIIIIIILSLIILFGLLQKYRKRHRRVLISPIHHNEIEAHEIREVEDRTESVYHEIDESAMKTLSPRQSFHHSYLEIRNSLHSTIHTKAKSRTRIASVSSKSQLVRQTSLRRQRCSIEGSSNDINSAERNEYSDGYLLPITRSIAQVRTMQSFSENRESLFRNNDKITSKPSHECINKESTGIGICRSMSYNKLVLRTLGPRRSISWTIRLTLRECI